MRHLDDPRVRALLLALWCLGWVAVAVLSLVPISIPGPRGSDKALHFATYALMTAAAVTFCRSPWRLLLIALAATLIGGVIEIAQGLVPYRSMSMADAVANALGALLGYALALAAALRLPVKKVSDTFSQKGV